MKQDVIDRAMRQVDAISRGEHSVLALRVKISGKSDRAPPWLEETLSGLFGRPVLVEWSKRVGPVASNTGVITDATTAEQRFYEDAARRGARTGD